MLARRRSSTVSEKNVEALFHHEPPEEPYHHVAIGHAVGAPPLQIAARGVEVSRSTPRDQIDTS
jgi:hypothetical protein